MFSTLPIAVFGLVVLVVLVVVGFLSKKIILSGSKHSFLYFVDLSIRMKKNKQSENCKYHVSYYSSIKVKKVGSILAS